MSKLRVLVLLPALGLALLACDAAVSPTPVPTPTPTPTPTPDPHLVEPTTADEIFRLLQVAGLRLIPTNAVAGRADDAFIKRINATYEGWPLQIVEYPSHGDLLADVAWDATAPIGAGEAPYALAGLNVLLRYGPRGANNATPPPPEAASRAAAEALGDALDRLVGPVAQHSLVQLPIPTPTSHPTERPVASPPASPAASTAPAG
jgi:hypothetical protein